MSRIVIQYANAGSGSSTETEIFVSNVQFQAVVSDNDTVNAGDGDDTNIGGYGNDILNEKVGNDTLSGGAGADILNGGAGINTADYSTSNAAVNVSPCRAPAPGAVRRATR